MMMQFFKCQFLYNLYHFISLLFKVVATIHLYQTAIYKRIVYAKSECINNLINSSKTVNSCLLIYVLFNLFRFFFLPWCLHKPRDNGIYRCSCSLKLLHKILTKGMNSRFDDTISQDHYMGMYTHLRACEKDTTAIGNDREELSTHNIMRIDSYFHHHIPILIGIFSK